MSGSGRDANMTQLPALHDCHAHMALDGADWKAALDRHRQAPDQAFVRATLQTYADAGTCYVREGGDRFGAGWLARSLAHDYGIEYASPVFPIHMKGDYGSFIGRSFETLSDFEHLVDEVAERGGDFVKVMLSGIMDFDEYGRITGHALPRELVFAMTDYCHGHGLAVMAHINGARAIQDAVEAGIDSIEHGYYSDEASREALANSNTVWVPTLAPVCNLIGTGRFSEDVLRHIAADQRSAVAQVADMGGKIACGSDAGAACVPHVQGARDEMNLLREALGDQCDAVLTRGFDEIRGRFSQRS